MSLLSKAKAIAETRRKQAADQLAKVDAERAKVRGHQLELVLQQFRGLTPDQISKEIASRGIKGRMGTTYRCPMALLLDSESTGEYIIGRKYIVRRSGGRIQKFHTPKNIGEFVRKFDGGGYPELISPPPRCLAPPVRKPGGRDRGPNAAPRSNRRHLASLVQRFDYMTQQRRKKRG